MKYNISISISQLALFNGLVLCACACVCICVCWYRRDCSQPMFQKAEFMKLVLSLLGFQGLGSDPYAFLASALPAEPSHSPPLALTLPPIGYLVNTDCHNWKESVGT